MDIVVGMRSIPQKYFTIPQKLGSWDSAAWKGLIAPTLTDEKTRLAYD
jgi:hypothetical protein